MIHAYYVILAVAAFIIDKNNRILIVKKSPYEKVDAGLWAVPGGKVEHDEPILQALARETKEEAGLDISKSLWIGEDVFENNSFWYHGQHYFCRVKKTGPVVLEKNLLQYVWISENELPGYEFHPNIKNRLVFIFKNLASLKKRFSYENNYQK